MKIGLNVNGLKKNYQQIQTVETDDVKMAEYLSKLYASKPLTNANTEVLLSVPYQEQIQRLIITLLEFGFDANKAEVLRKKFEGSMVVVNVYFSSKKDSNSKPLPIADLIKNKMEKAVYLLSTIDNIQRTNILKQVKYDGFACAEGTLLNLESLVRELSGQSKNLNYFISEAKRTLIDAKLQEEYKNNKFRELGQVTNGIEIHRVTSLVNSIAHEFGLAITSREKDQYLIDISVNVSQRAKDLMNAHLTQSGEALIDLITFNIQQRLPVAPAADASDENLIDFNESLSGFLDNLQIAWVSDFAITKEIEVNSITENEIAINKIKREIAVAYKPNLHNLIKDYIVYYVNHGYKTLLDNSINEISAKFLSISEDPEEKDNNFNNIYILMQKYKIANTELYGQIIFEATKALLQTNNMMFNNKQVRVAKAIRQQIENPFKEMHQLLVLDEREAKLLSEKISLLRAVDTEKDIKDLDSVDIDAAWEVILSHNLPLNADKYNTTDPWEYAIKNNLQIQGKHFLEHLYLNKINIQGKEVIAYTAEKLSSNNMQPLQSKLKGIFTNKEYAFDGYSDINTQEFLLNIGVEEKRINPSKKFMDLMLANFDKGKIERILNLLCYIKLDEYFANLMYYGLIHNCDILFKTAVKKLNEPSLTKNLISLLIDINGKKNTVLGHLIQLNYLEAANKLINEEGVNTTNLLSAVIELKDYPRANININPIYIAVENPNMLSMLLMQHRLNIEIFCNRQACNLAIKKCLTENKYSRSLAILLKNLPLTLGNLLDFWEPIFNRFTEQNSLEVIRVIFKKYEHDKVKILQRTINIDAPPPLSSKQTIYILLHILTKIHDISVLKEIFEGLNQNDWKQLLFSNNNEIAKWLLKNENNLALSKIMRIDTAANVINEYSNSKVKVDLKKLGPNIKLDDIAALYSADLIAEEKQLLRDAAVDIIFKQNDHTLYSPTEGAINPIYDQLSQLLFSDEATTLALIEKCYNVELNYKIFMCFVEIARHNPTTAPTYLLRILNCTKDKWSVLDQINANTKFNYMPLIIRDVYNSNIQHYKNHTKEMESLSRAFAKRTTILPAAIINSNDLKNTQNNFVEYITPIYAEERLKAHSLIDCDSDHLLQNQLEIAVQLKEIPFIRLFISKISAVLCLNYRELDLLLYLFRYVNEEENGNKKKSDKKKGDEKEGEKRETILHYALRTKSVQIVTAILESLPPQVAYPLIIKNIHSSSTFSKRNPTVNSPIRLARYLLLPDAIPAMVSAVYNKNWTSSIPNQIKTILLDEELTDDEFKSILVALHQKDDTIIKLFKNCKSDNSSAYIQKKSNHSSIYQGLSNEKKAIVDNFIKPVVEKEQKNVQTLSRLSSSLVTPQLNNVYSNSTSQLQFKRPSYQINTFVDFKHFLDNQAYGTTRHVELFRIYAEKTNRLNEFMDSGQINNNNNNRTLSPPLTTEELNLVEMAVEQFPGTNHDQDNTAGQKRIKTFEQ